MLRHSTMASAEAMELERLGYRALILYDCLKGLSVDDCPQSLHTVFRTCAPSQKTGYYWFREFRRGRSSVCDDDRCGRHVETY